MRNCTDKWYRLIIRHPRGTNQFEELQRQVVQYKYNSHAVMLEQD